LDASGYTEWMRLIGLKFAVVPALLLAALPQWAGAADIQISQAWARPTPPTAQVAAVYFSVSNHGTTEDRLLAVSSTAAGSVEIHETQLIKGVMQMRPVASVDCPPGATVKVEPGGLHVMLLALKQPLIEGTRMDLTLRFRDAGVLTIQVPVRNGP
jgi:periplasmic copper chaperone A